MSTIGPLLLLHFDGASGQTTTVDSSFYNKPITLLADAALSTAQTSPVGDSAVLLTGIVTNGSLAYTPFTSGSPLDLSVLPSWTIEFFARVTGSEDQSDALFALGEATDGATGFNGIRIHAPGSNQCVANIYGATTNPGYNITCTNFTLNVWHHVALVKRPNVLGAGDQYQLFVDGIGSGWTSSGSPYIGPYSHYFGYVTLSGYYSGPGGYNAFLNGAAGSYSELRIMGCQVYGVNFTPPTMPFSNTAGCPGAGTANTGKGDFTDPFAWQDINGNLPPLNFVSNSGGSNY